MLVSHLETPAAGTTAYPLWTHLLKSLSCNKYGCRRTQLPQRTPPAAMGSVSHAAKAQRKAQQAARAALVADLIACGLSPEQASSAGFPAYLESMQHSPLHHHSVELSVLEVLSAFVDTDINKDGSYTKARGATAMAAADAKNCGMVDELVRRRELLTWLPQLAASPQRKRDSQMQRGRSRAASGPGHPRHRRQFGAGAPYSPSDP